LYPVHPKPSRGLSIEFEPFEYLGIHTDEFAVKVRHVDELVAVLEVADKQPPGKPGVVDVPSLNFDRRAS
jgi:hypothetical protein